MNSNINLFVCRYLRASKWKLDTAITRIEKTLKWRREFGLYDILDANFIEFEVRYTTTTTTYSDISSIRSIFLNFQAVTGKQFTFGFDAKGRPAIYMVPSRQNTTDPVSQIQFVVWMLERALELMGPGIE